MAAPGSISKNVSLYGDHWAAVEDYAVELGLRGSQTRSPALQRIIDEWKVLRAAGAFQTFTPIVDHGSGMSLGSYGSLVDIYATELDPITAAQHSTPQDFPAATRLRSDGQRIVLDLYRRGHLTAHETANLLRMQAVPQPDADQQRFAALCPGEPDAALGDEAGSEAIEARTDTPPAQPPRRSDPSQG